MIPINKIVLVRFGVFIVTAIMITVVVSQVSFSQSIVESKIPPTPMLKPSDLNASNNEIMLQLSQRTISKVTDLAFGISEENKMAYVVQRVDGLYEQFLLPAGYTGDIRELMGLKESEKIITGFALMPIRSTPTSNKPEMQSTQVPINSEPYPYPLNQEAVQSPINPYPYP